MAAFPPMKQPRRLDRADKESLGFNEALQVRKNNARFYDSATSAVVVTKAFYLVEVVGGQDDPAERHAAGYRAGARAGNGYGSLFLVERARTSETSSAVSRKDDSVSISVAHITGVGKVRLDFVAVGFSQHFLRLNIFSFGISDFSFFIPTIPS